jgi:hypothetical protein
MLKITSFIVTLLFLTRFSRMVTDIDSLTAVHNGQVLRIAVRRLEIRDYEKHEETLAIYFRCTHFSSVDSLPIAFLKSTITFGFPLCPLPSTLLIQPIRSHLLPLH